MPDMPADIAGSTLVKDPIQFQSTGALTDGPSQVVGELSLAEAVNTALHSDAELQTALAKVRIALADAKQARLLPNPVLDVALRYPEGGGKPVIEAGLSADLVALLKIGRTTSAADNLLRAAGRDALTTALQTVSAVQEAYFAAQSLDGELAILEERQRLNRRLLDLATDRVNAGESPRLDVLTLQAQQAEIETETIQKEAERTDQRLMLARLIGQPSSNADWKLPAWVSPRGVHGSERLWIEAALVSRPEIQSKGWELAALGDEAAVSGLGILDGTSVGAASERDGDWSVGPAVTVPIPIFDMGQAKKERASAAVIQARHELTQARRRAVEDVRRAWASLIASNRALSKVQNELLPAQANRREQAEVAYKNGSADITAFLLAEQDLQASRAKLIEVQRGVSMAMVRLERSVGGAGVVQKLQAAASTQPTTATTAPIGH
jgi:cobalt-zinc-cadmium efflux system outer membrane protein